MDINNKIRKLRFELNLTQQEFADRIGISRPSLSNYEKGTRMPSMTVAQKICKEFNVSLSDIIDKDYSISASDSNLLKKSNLYEYQVNTKKSANHISYKLFRELLSSLGYPVESMEDMKLLKLYEASKEFYQFEMFKMGYIQIFED